jgi:hypothetical protein
MRVFIALLFAVCTFAACATEQVVTPATTSTSTSTTVEVVVAAPAPTTTQPPPPISVTTTTSPPTTIVEMAPQNVVATPVTDLEKMICDTFANDCGKALSVVYCESRFNPGTVGSAGERGLFQIHPVHIPYLADRGLSWDAMFDPASNIQYAYDLYARSGWGPWTCA